MALLFYKVRVAGGGTRFVECHPRSDGAVPGSGFAVHRNGARVEHRVEGGLAQELVVFDPSSVLLEMEMDLHYGELVPLGEVVRSIAK